MENPELDLEKILQDAKKDSSLFAEIDVDKLMDKMDNRKNEYLENKTVQNIIDENMEVLISLKLSKSEIKEILDKLTEYRHVDKIYELHTGKNVRWIRKDKKPVQLTNGGIVVDIKFLDQGIYILCKNSSNKYFQYKFDDCITFQKLSTDEQLILMLFDYAKNKK